MGWRISIGMAEIGIAEIGIASKQTDRKDGKAVTRR